MANTTSINDMSYTLGNEGIVQHFEHMKLDFSDKVSTCGPYEYSVSSNNANTTASFGVK